MASLPKKSKSFDEIVSDIKAEAEKWGGEVEWEKFYSTGGRLRQMDIKLTFKFH
jgi:hypothetical protein